MSASPKPLTKLIPKRTRAWKSWRPKFLDVLAQTGNVVLSCKAANVTAETVYAARLKSPELRAQWASAMNAAQQVLEAEAWRRAVKGVPEPVWLKDGSGQPVKVDEVRKYSDTLLIFLLKAADPKKYRENQRVELTGPEGRPVQVESKVASVHMDWAAFRSLWRTVKGVTDGNGSGGNGGGNGNGNGGGGAGGGGIVPARDGGAEPLHPAGADPEAGPVSRLPQL